MKKIILSFTLLLVFCSTVFAQSVPFPGPALVTAAAASCADTSCVGFLVCQNFETPTTGYDNSETWVESKSGDSAINPTNTTGPLRGTQDLLLTANTSSCLTYKSITAIGEVYGFARFSIGDATPTGYVSFIGLYNGGVGEFSVVLLTNAKIRIANGTTADSAGTLSDGVTYYMWFYYKPETGEGNNDGIAKVWISTTSTKPADACSLCASLTNGTKVDTVNRIYLQTASGAVIHFDQILLSATSIGNVCP